MSDSMSFSLPADLSPDWSDSDVVVLDLVQERAQLQLAEAAYLAARYEPAVRDAEALCARLDSLSAAPVSGGEPGERTAIRGMALTIIGLARLQLGSGAREEPSGNSRGVFEQAVADFRASGPSARSARYLQYLGIAQQLTERSVEALATLGRAIELGDASPDARRLHAAALRDVGRKQEAFVAVQELVRSAPDDWRAARLMAELMEELGAAPAAAAAYEAAARAARRADRHAETITLLSRALDLDEGDSRRRARLAALYLSADDPETALEVLAPVGATPDANPDLLLQLSDALLATGHYEEALLQTLKAMDATGDHSEPLRRVASARLGLGHAEEADAAADELLTIAPDDPFAGGVKGLARLRMGDFTAAATYLARALTRAGAQSDLFRSLVRTLATVEDSESAIKALDAPGLRHLGMQRLQGNLLLAQGRFEEAAAELGAVSGQLPHDPSLLIRHASALLGAGTTDRGLGILVSVSGRGQAGHAYDPADADEQVALLRGAAYRAQGDAAAAEQVYRRAQDELPPSRRVVWALVETLLDKAAQLDVDDRDDVLTEAADLMASAEDWETDPHGAVLHARIAHARGQDEGALAVLREARSRFPGDVELTTWSGLVAHHLGLHKDALDALRAARAERPGDPWIAQELGRVAMETGHFEEAREHLVAAHNLAPYDMRTVGLLSTLMREAGPVDEAAALLRQALEVHDDDARLWAELADCLVRQGREDDAADALDRVRELDPADGTTLAVSGHVLLRLGRLAEAEAALSRAVRRNPGSAAAHADLGEVFWRRGRPARALPELDQALRLPGSFGRALTIRASVHAALGDADAARADLTEALDHDPSSLEALRQMRLLADDADWLGKVRERVEAAIERAPHDAGLIRERAEILQRLGRRREAAELLDSLLRSHPSDVDTQLALGRFLLQEGRLRQAQGMFRQAQSSGCPDATLELAQASARTGDYGKALELVDGHLAGHREDPLALNMRARLLCELGEWYTAVEDATRAARAPRAYARVHQSLGWALQHTRKPRELVLAAFDRALEIDHTHVWARKGRANALYELTRRHEAEVEYGKVLGWARRQGEPAGTNASIAGWCLFRLGDLDEARQLYLRAVADNPRLGARIMDLGLVTLAGDDAGRASAYYERALSTLRDREWPHPRGVVAVALRDLELLLRDRPDLEKVADPLRSTLAAAYAEATARLPFEAEATPQPPLDAQETHESVVAVYAPG